MITLEQLRQVFPEEECNSYYTYLSNKNRGGMNNAKGNTFENFYTIYLIARYINLFFNNIVNDASIYFSAQAFSFVDDLEVEDIDNDVIGNYQIKDVADLNWNSGEHPISIDFQNQYLISSENGKLNLLFLVVSEEDVHTKLANTTPESIKKFTKVVCFDTASSINSLIRTNNRFKQSLIQICAISNPSPDKLDALGNILLGAWDGSSKSKVSCREILSYCYNLNPYYIKGHSEKISDKIHNVLSSIDGFTFKVDNGYLVWNYRETDKAILSYVIGSKEYIQWENDIFNLGQIQSFEDLEPHLV